MKIIFFFAIVISLSSCSEDKAWSESEVLDKYIYLFSRDNNTKIEYFECEINRFFKSEIENGEVWDEVYWIVLCNYNNKNSGMTYYIDSNSYLLFQDTT